MTRAEAAHGAGPRYGDGDLIVAADGELTLVRRRRAELPADVVAGPTVLTSDELAERYGADPQPSSSPASSGPA